MDATRPTTRCGWPVARGHLAGAQRLWRLLARSSATDLPGQLVGPADAQCCLGTGRAPPASVDRHGDGVCEALPDSILPEPNRRLLASLFLATALSISSVKIVAAVLREVDYLRRNLGQIILAAAILDDTMGWTILAFIGGLATQGRIVIGQVLFSILGTV